MDRPLRIRRRVTVTLVTASAPLGRRHRTSRGGDQATCVRQGGGFIPASVARGLHPLGELALALNLQRRQIAESGNSPQVSEKPSKFWANSGLFALRIGG